MPCRDYECDYQIWLQRGQEHLVHLTEMLRQLCRMAQDHALALPSSVARWREEPKGETEASLSKELLDSLARMLCSMCQLVEEKSLTMPPSVAAWWVEHKKRDGQPDDWGKGLDPSPDAADFWAMHATRQQSFAQAPGINYRDAVRALEKAGFRVLHQGKTITMTSETRRFLIPREDPVNPFAMARIIGLAGLTEEEFRKLLQGRSE